MQEIFLQHTKFCSNATGANCIQQEWTILAADILSYTQNAKSHAIDMPYSGLQLRKSEQNGFDDNFLISQPNPMMWPSL